LKTIILAGGFGTRLSEYTESIPKPMVTIGGRPIIWHIMNYYSHYSYNQFYLALGYKAEYIKNYFYNYHDLNSDFSINLGNGEISSLNKNSLDVEVTLIDTGLNSMTGYRVKSLQEYIGNETFMLTYGDGLSDVNIPDLIRFHKSHGKMITVTAVRPIARFGELEINEDQVMSFLEKPQISQGWINGGYFIIEPKFFDYIEDNHTAVLEKEPLEKAAREGELMAYQHNGFWQCMDTKRDRDLLESLWEDNKAPWSIGHEKDLSK